jgi:lipid-binding SYLF domain-containing protein
VIRTTRFATLFVFAAAILAGCATTQINTAEEKDRLAREAQASRQEWNQLDPTAEGFVKKGYGYAFFPEIGKGGFIFAGGGGNGVVYEQGQHVGYAELVEGSIGFTVGGQSYSELIVFENKAAMDRFKKSEMNFWANAYAANGLRGHRKGRRWRQRRVPGRRGGLRPATRRCHAGCVARGAAHQVHP